MANLFLRVVYDADIDRRLRVGARQQGHSADSRDYHDHQQADGPPFVF